MTGARLTLAARVLLMLTLALICLPLAPLMPSWGLDASFALAVNQAQADGLVFGREVVFTLGPYGALYSALYHPGTDWLMLGSAALLAAGYATVIWQLRPTAWPTLLAALLLASLVTSRDALLLCYPLLALLALLYGRNGAVLLAAPLGLLLLTKVSLLPPVVLVLGSALLVLAWRGDWRRALIFAGSALSSLLLLWQIADQPLAALPDYFLNQLPLINGFAEAMWVAGPERQLWMWLAMAALLFIFVTWQCRELPRLARCVWLLNLLALLFIAFKAGFVRHDMHAIIASNCLLLVVCVLLGWGRRLAATAALISALFAWQQLDVMHPYADRPALHARAAHFYTDKARALLARLQQPALLHERYQAALAELQQRYQFPRLDKGVDIYSANQAELIASDNRWQPRPVFQSYTAYTPALAALNREHLASERAAAYLLFKIEAIDGRLPALEDGASWPLLLRHYRLDKVAENGYLYFSRNPQPAPPAEPARNNLQGTLGRALLLPGGEWTASFRLHKTLYGHLRGLLFRSEELRIGVELADGRHLDYRFAPGLAREPIPLSPLVLDTEGFARLSRADTALLRNNRVVALNLYCPSGCRSWSPAFELELLSFVTPGED